MNSKLLFSTMSQGLMPHRIPFAPTIYEHAARIINTTPSQIAQDANALFAAQCAAFDAYGHDLVTVGVDIYNIEAEALGGHVEFFEDEKLPQLHGAIINHIDDVAHLKLPNPKKDGRMPVMIEATRLINREIGRYVPVGGTVVGPFTLAAIIRGFEDFLIDMLEEPLKATLLMRFAMGVSLSMAKCYAELGVGISINESWVAPPLLPPSWYRQYVLPIETEMIAKIKDMGIPSIALICGGNTTPIANDMAKTGSSLLLADAGCDLKRYLSICKEHNITLRASIASALVELGNYDSISESTKSVIQSCVGYNKFVFGCGVVSYSTPPEKIKLLKQIVEELDPRTN